MSAKNKAKGHRTAMGVRPQILNLEKSLRAMTASYQLRHAKSWRDNHRLHTGLHVLMCRGLPASKSQLPLKYFHDMQRVMAESEKSHRESECQRENADIAEALMRNKDETTLSSCLLKSFNIVQFHLTPCAMCPEVSNALRTSAKLNAQAH